MFEKMVVSLEFALTTLVTRQRNGCDEIAIPVMRDLDDNDVRFWLQLFDHCSEYTNVWLVMVETMKYQRQPIIFLWKKGVSTDKTTDIPSDLIVDPKDRVDLNPSGLYHWEKKTWWLSWASTYLSIVLEAHVIKGMHPKWVLKLGYHPNIDIWKTTFLFVRQLLGVQ